VILERLVLRGFRNLEDAELAIPQHGFALVGENAQGKSNLLEAIHYLEIFRSFRGSRDSRMIAFGAPLFRLEGTLVSGAVAPADAPPLRVAAAVQRAGEPKKRVTVDGQVPVRLGDALGRVGSVLFTPDDVRLVSDEPDGRRRFLDVLLSVNVPGYLAVLLRYRQILAQRNAALRDGAPLPSVQVWDAMLADAGGQVAAARAHWVQGVADAFRRVYEGISGGESAALRHESGIPRPERTGDAADWSAVLLEALRDGLEGDRKRGSTRAGPHRDDLRIEVLPADAPPRDLREFGSGGQRRTAALALRILEGETIRERTGTPPLLLLDDVFAELDLPRSERLMAQLEETARGQVILTAPKVSDLRFRVAELPQWGIHRGQIRPGDDA
jgi:DNA replication and repair protein RecF